MKLHYVFKDKTQAAKMCFCSDNFSPFFNVEKMQQYSKSKLELILKKSSSSDAKNVGLCLCLSFLHFKPD